MGLNLGTCLSDEWILRRLIGKGGMDKIGVKRLLAAGQILLGSAAVVAGLAHCNEVFATKEPHPVVDDSLVECAASDGPGEVKWYAIAGPETDDIVKGDGPVSPNAGAGNNPVRDAVLLRDTIVFSDGLQVYAAPLAALRQRLVERSGELKMHPIYLNNRDSARSEARSIQGLAHSAGLVHGGSEFLYALSCRWQMGCTLDIAEEQDWGRAAPPPPDWAPPCTVDSDTGEATGVSELLGARAHACFPFAAPVAQGSTREFFPLGKALSNTAIAACSTQGKGGAENQASSFGCIQGTLGHGGKQLGDAGTFAYDESDLTTLKATLRDVAMDVREVTAGAGPTRNFLRIVANEGLYVANAGTTKSLGFVDLLATQAPRQVTAHAFADGATLLGVRAVTDGGFRHALWSVSQVYKREPIHQLDVAASTSTEVFWRKGEIIAVSNLPLPSGSTEARSIHWVEQIQKGAEASQRGLFRWDPGAQCARRIHAPSTEAVPNGLGVAGSSVKLMPRVSDNARPECRAEELFILADGVLWWGIAPCSG